MLSTILIAIMHMGELPDVAGICAAHIVYRSIILLRNADGVEVKDETLRILREHKNVVVARGKSLRFADSLRVIPGDP